MIPMDAAFWFVAVSMFLSGALLWWFGEETHPRFNPEPAEEMTDAVGPAS